MPQNRGKQFEQVVRESFEKVPNTSVYRLIDAMGGYLAVANVSDYIVYHYPYQYFLECKAIHGNTLSINSNDPKRKYGNISNTQWEGMLELSKIKGVHCGVICWFIDHDVTMYLDIGDLQIAKDLGDKSIRFDEPYLPIEGQKKRVFFEYDMQKFFERFEVK